MSYTPPTPPTASEPPPEAPVTPPYGTSPPYDDWSASDDTLPSGTPRPAIGSAPVYAQGQAAPPYPPTARYPAVTAPPPYPPRRTRGGLLAGIAAAVIIAVLLCIGGIVAALALGRGGEGQTAAPGAPTQAAESQPPADASPTRPPAPTAHVIVYEVVGDGPANVTYMKDPKGATEQIGRADLPWRVEINMGEDAFLATVLAIRIGATKGALTCRLLVDDVEVSTRSSEGRFAAVTCSDLVLG
jgi:hypothetical protein